ncbi:MAG TPA: hypothetical protein VFZ13_08200 [Gemmatimonadales bacterium]
MNVLPVPDRLFTVPIILRGSFIWGCLRAALALLPWFMSGFEERFTVAVTVGAAAWIVLVVAALGLLDIRRRNEHLLLANLGFRQRTLAILAGLPAFVGEVAIAAAWSDAAPRG